MRRPLALRPEVLDAPREALAEAELPQAVGEHARGERVVARGEPAREVEPRRPSRRVASAGGLQEPRDGGRHHLARVVEPVAARQHAHGLGVLRRRDVGLRQRVDERLALELGGAQLGARGCELGRLAPVELRERGLLVLAARLRIEGGGLDQIGPGLGSRRRADRERVGRSREAQPAERAQAARVLVHDERERRGLALAQDRRRELDHQPVALAVGRAQRPAAVLRVAVDRGRGGRAVAVGAWRPSRSGARAAGRPRRGPRSRRRRSRPSGRAPVRRAGAPRRSAPRAAAP